MNQILNETQNSWISIKSLKKESEISFLYTERPEIDLPDVCSPKSEASISKEPKSTTETNDSINVINTLTPYWQQGFEKQRKFSYSPKNQNREIHGKDTKYSKILKKYEIRIQTLKNEINTLKPKLLSSQNKVQELLSLLKYTQNTHALQIQQLQKHHEQRVQKMQKDFESILNSLMTPEKNQSKKLQTTFKNSLKPLIPRIRNNSTPV